MLYFNPKPNYAVLSKHYALPYDVEFMEKNYSDGFPIVLDHIYTDEAVAELGEGFAQITKKHHLEEHHDNLLFLTLDKVGEHEAVLDELFYQYGQKRRTKELAGLLLALSSSSVKQYDSLVLKTLKSTAKITDKSVINWVGSTLTDAIKQGKMSLTDYEYRIIKDFFEESENGLILSVSKLTAESNRKVNFPTRNVRDCHADICLYLYYYLVNETTIKPNAERLFSDAMLNFYFDLLTLLGYLKVDEIESEGKDYMGTLLKNRVKKFNPDYQRNINR